MSLPEQHEENFNVVLQQEHEWLSVRRGATGLYAKEEMEPDNVCKDVVGVSFSGGGIRSATFNLGILQALEQNQLLDRVDYLSSVSGGGYIASCLTWLRAHIPVGNQTSLFSTPLHKARGTVLDWIRSHDKYLINEPQFTGWTLAASVLAAVMLNLIVLLPLIFLIMNIAAGDLPPIQWPDWLHLPGASPIDGHDGFALILAAGTVSVGLYAISILLFALISGVSTLRSMIAILTIRKTMGILLAWGVALIMVGLIPAVVGLDESALHYFANDSWSVVARHSTYLVPIISGALAMIGANRRRKRRGISSELLASFGLSLLVYGLLLLAYHFTRHTGLVESNYFLLTLALSLFLATVCDINWVSMHSYYRSRLASAYLAPIKPKDFTPVHFKMHKISPQSGGPLHIINTTINTTSSDHEKSRARGGENFIFTPLYCGSSGTGYVPTEHYLDGHVTLSTACTISGAAVDPNTYATRSRPVAFLMALFNLRLGFWAPNPRYPSMRLPLPWWYLLIGREMLGRGLSENQRHVHLSDGGHFENLGLYELLRRRCRYIIVCDAGEDRQTTLADLGQVVERARADFAVEVDIKADRLYQESLKPLSDCPFIVGSARYIDGTSAEILYIKPLMRSSLTVDIYAYWRDNPSFPNESTANQFFTEPQFNAYRELGRQMFQGIVGDTPIKNIEELFQRARAADCTSALNPDLVCPA